MSKIKNKKIIVILGPTASGKTGLAVKLAYKFNGEIVSADSRQVYRGMDIGTGKDLAEYKIKPKAITALAEPPQGGKIKKKSKVINIPYHLIDIVSPMTEFSLAKYQDLAYKAIDNILERDKLPIIAGGTGLYLQALVDNYNLSSIKPDKKLRNELEKKNVKELFSILKKINSKFLNKLNESDQKNKRRLIRYIEILKNNKVIEKPINNPKYDFLLIGIKKEKEILQERIYKRLIERLEKEDMVGEVEKLRKEKVSWQRLEDFGLEYRFIGRYLQEKIDYKEMVEKLYIAIRQFSKRQMTWFRRWEKQGEKINWIENNNEAEDLIKKFLK